MPTKIALAGKMRSGKSTISLHLFLEHGFDQVSFGDSLKHHANQLFGITKYDEKPRRLYQQFGQKMREIEPDIWVRKVAERVGYLEDSRSTRGIVIDDLRQPDEYEWARANGFTIVRISANEDTRLERARQAGDNFSVEDLRHETEMHVDDFEVDFEIWNDDNDIDELGRRIDEIVAEIAYNGNGDVFYSVK